MPYISNAAAGSVVWHDPSENYQLQTGETDIGTEFVLPARTKAQQLSDAQNAQMGVMLAAYSAAISVSVSFTNGAAVAQIYQADPDSRAKLSDMLNSFAQQGQTPAGFYWIAEDDTKVPFSYADLQGLAAVVGVQGWAAFQRLQTAKAAINGAKTVAAVQAITWPA